MLRLGLLDFDSSHCVEFTSRLNQQHPEPNQWVEGAQVVVACPGQSLLSPERIPGHTEQMRQMAVPLVDRPADMIGRVDGMLIESIDGNVHLERARPFIEAGVPCFVDKPLACSLADARCLAELAQRHKVAVFSSSAMRYAPDLVQFLNEPRKVDGVIVHGPAHRHERNPGLFHYGIHAVETLFTLMGPGCGTVACSSEDNVDIVTGAWRDGRVGTVRGLRNGPLDYGALIFDAGGTTYLPLPTPYVYRELLKQVVALFQTGTAPLDINITLELIAFIEAAWRSQQNGGTREALSP